MLNPPPSERHVGGESFGRRPCKTNDYDRAECVIFLCKVLLGQLEVLTQPNQHLVSPSPGYHAVNGTNGHAGAFQEYVVFRYGQAKPYWKNVHQEINSSHPSNVQEFALVAKLAFALTKKSTHSGLLPVVQIKALVTKSAFSLQKKLASLGR